MSALWEAIHAFQAEAPTLQKHAEGHNYKYTPLDTIVEQLKPLMEKHGLAFSAMPSRDDENRPLLRYSLVHVESGEELSGVMPLFMGKQSSQELGSAITYARRYSLASVLNLVFDVDTDGVPPRIADPDPPAAKPFGVKADSNQTARAVRAVLRLCEGDEVRAKAEREHLKEHFGGYLPAAAAYALERASKFTRVGGEPIEPVFIDPTGDIPIDEEAGYGHESQDKADEERPLPASSDAS